MQTYGLLGKNISYSLSPFMHNAAFKALDIKATYKIFDMPENKLDGFFGMLRSGEISGANVTVPYKEKVVGLVDVADQKVRSIGALNTIVRKQKLLVGHNTDCEGFLEALRGKGEGNLGFDERGKSVFVFGAGGAAKAVIYSLLRTGIKKIDIADIDREKAERLASVASEAQEGNVIITVVKEKRQYDDFISRADLLVNATPCGMKKTDPTLFDYRFIHEKLFVFDLVYAVETPLLKAARETARKAINGMNMLLYQAAHSFTFWTERAAPIEAMRKALMENICR
ncbi:shikimate dehydrogenase [Candidatus Omnitrophota bacterium]